MQHKEIADYYTKIFGVKVTASFVKRNYEALKDAGWLFDGMDLLSPQTVIGSVRDDFIMFCSKHTVPSKSKELWDICKAFSDFTKRVYGIHMSKHWVYKHYKALREAGWIVDACDYKVGGLTDDQTVEKFRAFVASTEPPAEVKPKPKAKPKPKSQDSELRIALWFIREIGNIERAKKVFNAACLASEALK